MSIAQHKANPSIDTDAGRKAAQAPRLHVEVHRPAMPFRRSHMPATSLVRRRVCEEA